MKWLLNPQDWAVSEGLRAARPDLEIWQVLPGGLPGILLNAWVVDPLRRIFSHTRATRAGGGCIGSFGCHVDPAWDGEDYETDVRP